MFLTENRWCSLTTRSLSETREKCLRYVQDRWPAAPGSIRESSAFGFLSDTAIDFTKLCIPPSNQSRLGIMVKISAMPYTAQFSISNILPMGKQANKLVPTLFEIESFINIRVPNYSIYRSLLLAACEKRSILMFDPLCRRFIHAIDNAHTDSVNCVRYEFSKYNEISESFSRLSCTIKYFHYKVNPETCFFLLIMRNGLRKLKYKFFIHGP